MIDYPASFPCPSRIEGHSQDMSAGLVRTPMEAGNSRQRRTHRMLPTRIALTFMIEQPDYAGWLTWVNENAWDDWVNMKLPGLVASRLGVNTAAIAVRFMSDPRAELLPVHRLWWWRVRVEAEYLPTAEQIAPVFAGKWIVGGSPLAPSLDWVLGGTPLTSPTDLTQPGTVAKPVTVA
jgi:hypothetical protein